MVALGTGFQAQVLLRWEEASIRGGGNLRTEVLQEIKVDVWPLQGENKDEGTKVWLKLAQEPAVPAQGSGVSTSITIRWAWMKGLLFPWSCLQAPLSC